MGVPYIIAISLVVGILLCVLFYHLGLAWSSGYHRAKRMFINRLVKDSKKENG